VLEMAGPVGIDIVRNLVDRSILDPVYWSGYDEIADAVKQEFKSTVYHDVRLAIRGIPPVELNNIRLRPLDEITLVKYAEVERLVINMMDRMDPDQRSFRLHERQRHFRRLLQFWLAAVQELEPHVAIFPISPHSIYDYVCYAVCKQKNISTIMFDRTALPEHVLCISDIDQGSLELRDQYAARLAGEKDAVQVVSLKTADWLKRWRGDYARGMPANFQNKLKLNRLDSPNGSVVIPNLLFALNREIKRTAVAAFQNSGRAPQNYLKQSGKTPEDSWFSLINWSVNNIRGLLYKYKLRRACYLLQSPPPSDKPYIFLALHYQPERNSNPVGGIFADQVLAVEMIAKNLPEGWKVVVKEHTQQLHPYSKGERSRDISFYRDINHISNVCLVSENLSSFDLIDGAAAVATISGSAGWEALCRGKATLVFGAAWYQYCRGVFRIRTNDECRLALRRIADGLVASDSDIKIFLSTLENVSCKGIIDPTIEERGNLDDSMIARNMALAIEIQLNKVHI
jgi:hypothetical protein